MVVEARGGLGKSTLLAKFVLDHALAQSRRFPFAYLDFDRAGIDPERPHQVLLEVVRQIALQYPTAQDGLVRLAEDIRSELVSSAPSSTSPTKGNIQDPFASFVELLREHATFGRRAFLLVFDTVEIVQWNAATMGKLAALVDELRRKGLDELRVVASGRADIPELRKVQGREVPSEHIMLKPLLVAEARQMVKALGEASVGGEWRPAWSSAIAGTGRDDDARREPLALRIAVDLVVRVPAERRQTVVDDIAREGLEGSGDFVARLYEKRIVEHVRDPLARKLAWPGLVVRRVTAEITRELLAESCGIPKEDAGRAFNALGQEIWMVTREGDALRHRPDLRARTLPLMRRKDPVRFGKVAERAVAYFGEHRQRSAEDYAEWIYHRLLAGESPEQVERDITDATLGRLAQAEDDFPAGSPAASYVMSRTARRRLSPQRLQSLLPKDALYHLSVTSPGAFALDDDEIDPVVRDLAHRIPSAIPENLQAWANALWIKTGAWKQLPWRLETSAFAPPILRVHLFWAAHVAQSMDPVDRAQLAAYWLRALTVASTQPERAGIRTTIQAMALAAIAAPDSFAELDLQVSRMLARTKPSPLPSAQAALRTAIVVGERSRGPALRLWLASRRRGRTERVRDPTFSAAELRAMARSWPVAADALAALVDLTDERPLRFADEMRVGTAHRLLEELLGESTEDQTWSNGSVAASVFACRDEDWVVPLGYAAARATGGRISATISERLASYDDGTQNAVQSQPPTDMLAAMRLADEAGDLHTFAQAVLAECLPSTGAVSDLAFLLSCRNAWTDATRRAISAVATPDVTAQAFPSDQPPNPGPILHPDDPQKGRWGGMSARDGRTVRAVLESVEDETFYFSVVVESTDGTTLEPPLVFHMHDSYPRSVVTIRRVVDGRFATVSEWSAYGVFAIGVQVKAANGKWTSLELDLAELPGLPKRFLGR
jgi:hypothetical protein